MPAGYENGARLLALLAKQLASLRRFLAVYTSLSAVARRKARLVAGLLAAALAGLDFHQLDSLRKVSPAHIDSPSPSLCSARYSDYPPSLHPAARRGA